MPDIRSRELEQSDAREAKRLLAGVGEPGEKLRVVERTVGEDARDLARGGEDRGLDGGVGSIFECHDFPIAGTVAVEADAGPGLVGKTGMDTGMPIGHRKAESHPVGAPLTAEQHR